MRALLFLLALVSLHVPAADQPLKVGGGETGFDFTALNASGQPATPTAGATPHSCVRDNITGLVWEVKTADGGLRDRNWTYTWYASLHNQGGKPGMASGGSCKNTGRCDTEKYVADVRATALCGFSDWRMPSRQELQRIALMGRDNPGDALTYFPNTPSSYCWSGSPKTDGLSYAWYVDFNYGLVFHVTRSHGFQGLVRLVRGGK